MALLPDYTVSGDTTPIWSETVNGIAIDSSQYGFPISGGTTRIYTKAQVWTQDSTRKRHGTYGVKCTSFHDATNLANNHSSMGMGIIVDMGRPAGVKLVEGDEEWIGWSWYFPSSWPGVSGGTWCILWEWGSGDVTKHPRNGSGFQAWDPNRLTWLMHNGRTQNPGGEAGFDLNGTYNVEETILGGTGLPPFTKDVWHDFYMHTIYRAKTNGVVELWHRQEGQSFAKLYSNKNDGTAIINRAPHPTWHWNAAYDVPGGTGTAGSSNDGAHWIGYRVYRSQGTWNTTHDMIYWADGFFRRQSEQAILNEFAASQSPSAPTITSFTPTSGTAGVTSVTINGTNFTSTGTITFNGVAVISAAFIDSSQITATVPPTATTGKIQVTTTAGTGISLTDFTVGATSAPVLPDPAVNHLRIGNSQEGAYTTGVLPDTKRVIKRNVGAGKTAIIDQAYALVAGDPSAGAETLRLVVYDDDGATALPGTLLGSSDQASVAQAAAAAWVSFTFTTPVVVNGGTSGDVYFGLHFGGPGSVSFSYQSATGQGWRIADTYSDGPSNPFGINPVVINIEPSFVVDYTLTGDTVAPVFVAATVTNTALELNYDEALDPTSIPASSAFAVTVNQLPWPISSVSIVGSSVQLLLGQAVNPDDIVTVAYTVPGANEIQDAAGNPSVSLTAQAVGNQTQPPVNQRSISPAQRTATARVITASRRPAAGGGL